MFASGAIDQFLRGSIERGMRGEAFRSPVGWR